MLRNTRNVLLLAMLNLTACTSIPERRYAIRSIDIQGTNALDSAELEEHLASRESPKFLGLADGIIYDYQVFNRYVLEADLQRIERYYRARGYYRARVRAGRVDYEDTRYVRVKIVVEEGPAVLVERVEIHGLEPVSPEVSTLARNATANELAAGERFDEDAFVRAAEELRRTLADNGYAHAHVERRARVDLPGNRARVRLHVEPGPLARFGEVTIEGLGPVPEESVRQALDIEPGTPFSESELENAEQAVLDLGVFSSVSVRPDLPRKRRREKGGRGEPRGEEKLTQNSRREASRRFSRPRHGAGRSQRERPSEVPVRVVVDPSKLHSVRLGAGLHADTLRTDVHLTAGYEHQNLFGGLQHFLVELTPGVVLYPTRLPGLRAPQELLPEARVRSELRHPGFLEARTNALLRAQASVYPVLLTSEPDEGAPILGYQDLRASAGLERRLRKLYGTLSHNVQVNRPFTYSGELDPDLGTAVVSYPELLTKLDFRDDAVTPHRGVYAENRFQVAGVGGDAVDLKVEPEARFYIPLGRKLTLASRAAVGLLFAQNYGQTVLPNALSGQPGDASRAEWVKDVQLMFLRGLFSGGSTSNRGYQAREIGPHGVVPFYNPGQSSPAIVDSCAEGSPEADRSQCKLPLGGFTLWEASVELRFPVVGPLRGAVFSDASDVAPEKLLFRFNRLHLSAGMGARYETPVGPIRLDVGYRIPGLQAPVGAADEGTPGDVLGLPIAVALGIGAPF